MSVKEIIFNKEKVLDLANNFNSMCIKCNQIGVGCKNCSIEETKSLLEKIVFEDGTSPEFKRYTVLNDLEVDEHIGDLEFAKNDIMITQNALEEVCVSCSFIGTYCLDCDMHETRRNLASLTFKEIKLNIEPKEKAAKSGGGCGTSCSTGGCSTKKKK